MSKKNKQGNMATFFSGTYLLVLISCGSDNNNGSHPSLSSSVQEEQRIEQQQADEGIYRAVLKPMNASVSGNTSGTVEVRINGDEVLMESSITGAPVNVKHLQLIHTGTRCAEMDSDVNSDGFVDANEAIAVYGQILIPLDSDLDTQLDGMTYGPIANASGAYVYRRSTSLTDLLADLRSPDPDSADSVVKLPLGQELNLAGRVIEVRGVSSTQTLPQSVATVDGLSPHQSLPIACGVFKRIESEDASAPGVMTP